MSGVYLLKPTGANGYILPADANGPPAEVSAEIMNFFQYCETTWRPPDDWSLDTGIVGRPGACQIHYFVLVVTPKLWTSLSPCLDDYVDLYPVTVGVTDYLAVRAKRYYDSILDIEASEVRLFPSGAIMGVRRYLFESDDTLTAFQDSSGRHRLFVAGQVAECLEKTLEGDNITDLELADVSVKPPPGRPTW